MILSLLLFLTFIILPIFHIQNQKQLLKRDINTLYTTAKKLDWTESHHLNYARVNSTGIGLGPSYDVLEIIYKTDLSINEFTEILNKLGYKSRSEQYTMKEDFNFLYRPSNELTTKLELRNPDEVIRQNPKITVWNFYHPKTNKLITVNFAEANEGEVWLYDKQPVNGNIVEIELVRHH